MTPPIMTLTRIQAFEPIFTKLNFEHPRSAAAYYVCLIEDFPTNFQSIKEKARSIYYKEITPNKLQIGRRELLNNGFIAQVVLRDQMPEPKKKLKIKGKLEKFGSEAYLPVSPLLAWDLNKDILNVGPKSNLPLKRLVSDFEKKKAAKKQDKKEIIPNKREKTESKSELFPPEELAHRAEIVNKFEERCFKKRFKKYGIGTEESVVTVLYEKPWLMYTLINNLDSDSILSLMLSGLRSFEPPYLKFHEYMVQKAVNSIRVIYQKEDGDGVTKARLLQERSKNKVKIELKHIKLNPVTSRRAIIKDKLAIDARKIIFRNGTIENPSYIGTIYLQNKEIVDINKVIEAMENYFEQMWTLS